MPQPRVYRATEREEEAGAVPTPAEFPIHTLPRVLRRHAEAIAEVTRVPAAMTAPMVLATASAAIGRGLLVGSLNGHETPANLFFLISKSSGSGGSSAFAKATAPLMGLQALLRREFDENERPRLEARRERIEAEIGRLRKAMGKSEEGEQGQFEEDMRKAKRDLAEVEKELHEPLLVASDATSEGMSHLLSIHDQTLSHFDSDAADALGSILGRYQEGGHIADSLWLKGFTMEPVTIVRKGAKTIYLDRPCISVLFLVTGDKAEELYQKRRLVEGGLLPRMLVCDPKAKREPIPEETAGKVAQIPTEVSQPYEAAIWAVARAYRLSGGEEGEPYRIDMEEAARAVYARDYNRTCRAINPEAAEDAFDARDTENAIRLGLVLHAFRHLDIRHESGGHYTVARVAGHETALEEATARDALEIRDWFRAHQRAFLEPRKVAADDERWTKMKNLLHDLPNGATLRDLYRGRRIADDKAEAERLVAAWIEEGRLRAEVRKPDGAGRPTTVYTLARRSGRPD
jgi:hypothetical protein